MADEKNVQNTEEQPQQPNNADPAGTGDQGSGGKTFTQEEVNRIVSDRLAREKAKGAQESDRETALSARENALECREFIEKNRDYPAKLLEILDTSNFKDFKAKADKLMEAFPEISATRAKFAPFSAPMGGDHNTSSHDEFAEAFKPRT